MSKKKDFDRQRDLLMSYEKKRAEFDKKQKHFNELDKKLNFLAKDEARRKRANRLIQTGALAEKYFDTSHLNPEQIEELFKMFSDYINHKKPDKFKK